MPSAIEVELAGYSFQLFADRGLYWDHQSTLFVADTHFGKEATFRAQGIPVPIGSTQGTLSKIAKMLSKSGAKRLCILGDMFHAKSSLSPDVRETMETFFAATSGIEWMLVEGNHDVRVGQLPSNWPIKALAKTFITDRIALGHHPTELPVGADLYLCGHVHPAIRISTRSESLGNLPCFWLSKGCLVLPAIGEFTGTYRVQLSEGDVAWIATDADVYKWC